MASIPKEAQDVVRGVNVTIVDLIGALLPGLVWFVLLATVVSLVRAPSGASPLQTVEDVLQGGTKHGGAFYAGVGLAAILLGWVIKAVGLNLAERLCVCFIWLPHRWLRLWRAVRPGRREESAEHTRKPAEPPSYSFTDLLFPYDRIVNDEHSEAFKVATEFATAHLGVQSTKAPGSQPFDACKLLLRQSEPLCREEVERAEAQVVLLGSLFLAAIFSLATAVVAGILGLTSPWGWIAGSTAAVVLLGYSFRKDRRAEVNRTYLMALVIAERGREKEQERAQAAAAGGAGRHSR